MSRPTFALVRAPNCLGAFAVKFHVHDRVAHLLDAPIGVRDVLARHLRLPLDHDLPHDVLAIGSLRNSGKIS